MKTGTELWVDYKTGRSNPTGREPSLNAILCIVEFAVWAKLVQRTQLWKSMVEMMLVTSNCIRTVANKFPLCEREQKKDINIC